MEQDGIGVAGGWLVEVDRVRKQVNRRGVSWGSARREGVTRDREWARRDDKREKKRKK